MAAVVSDVWAPEASSERAFGDGVVVGIDLGTSNSCIAVWHLDKFRVKVFKSQSGRKTTPSVVRWDAGADPTRKLGLVRCSPFFAYCSYY